MSIARHHNEWLSLVPNSGPFLSLPVATQAFPQGLDAHDPEHARRLRQAHEEWDEDQTGKRPSPVTHRAWIRFVLNETLGYDQTLVEGQAIPQTLRSEVAEYGETLRPDFILVDPETKKARLLIQTYSLTQALDKPVTASRWKTSPDTRMAQLLRDTGVRLGLVTNGEHWMLVNARPNDTSGYASWYASLWIEESITLRAFRTLLGVERFFGVAANDTIESLLDRSADDQQEVTDQLGYQVRKAVEVLIQALDKADQDHGRELFSNVGEKVLYEAALTVMMRLVFLFCAEERGLLLLGDDLWDRNYAVSTLREQLRTAADQHGEEILGFRHDAWTRLLTTFRAVFGGVKHDRFKLPAYGGSLFNPDRFPFLEGRKQGTFWRDTEATPLPVSNRTVLHLLEALQVLQVRLPGGGPAEARKLSFRSLDIEQIGHVYEGLLDHTAKRATEPYLGLRGTRDKEPEIALAELETLVRKGEDDLVAALKDETGRSESALKRALHAEIDAELASRFRTACHEYPDLMERTAHLAGLVREDSTGYPVVITPGSVFVTKGTDRRSTGTHYTPRSLTEPIVQYTLEPLVYVGPAEGQPKEQWKLRPAKELLGLKICDMACGSGAFLVQACRYMAARLLEAWDEVQRANPGTVRVTPEGLPSTGQPGETLIPDDPDERQTYALRIVAQRCLYGVDKNPLAAEMAKLSLWLLTLAKDKPFEFLDHAIRCGDSLVGIHDLDQLRKFNLDGKGETNPLFLGFLDEKIKETIELRCRLAALPANAVEEIETQERLLSEAELRTVLLRCCADLLISAEFVPASRANKDVARVQAARKVEVLFHESESSFRSEAAQALDGKRPFHWPLEFPEVLVTRQGFDAFVGNPPFVGNKYWKDRLPQGFQGWAEQLTGGKVGKIDVVAVFLRRAYSLLRHGGSGGLIATTTAREGDTLRVGFAWIKQHGALYRAISQRDWPGQAGVHLCVAWFSRGPSEQQPYIDGMQVDSISPSLTANSAQESPRPLSRALWAYKGSDNSRGEPFIVFPGSDWFERLAQSGSPFLRPYLTGEDITTGTYRTPTRYVIDCQDSTFEDVLERSPTTAKFLLEVAKPRRTPADLQSYPGLAERWWQMWNHRAGQYRSLRKDATCVVMPVVSKHIDLVELPTSYVFTNKVCIFKKPSTSSLLSLLGSLFEAWVVEHGGTLRAGTLTVTLDKCVEPYPCPEVPVTDAEKHVGQWFKRVERVMDDTGGGFTKVFNRMHEFGDKSEAVSLLRASREAIDASCLRAYGWTDIDCGHGFHDTKQGVRFTLSEPARREVLARLLKLNHQRYEEEVREGLHDKTKSKAGKDKKKTGPDGDRPTLFEQARDEEA